jgi:hypothetical protein
MKLNYKQALLAMTGVALFANPAMGAVSLENGSLAVAFYQVNTGNTVGPNTLVVDLGQASLYRENTGYNVSVSTVNSGIVNGNIGTALTAAFGSNWADSGTVRWMVVGNVGQGTGPISGDPGRTNYFSVANNDFNVGTTFPTIASGVRIQASNQITAFFNGTQSETATVSNADAAQIPTSALFSPDEYVNPTTPGLYFQIGQDITQTLASGSISGPQGLEFEGALDIYRMLHTTTGADLTVGYTGGNSVAGTGKYIGTITLDSLGNLSVIPEPSSALLGLAGAFGLVLRRRRLA